MSGSSSATRMVPLRVFIGVNGPSYPHSPAIFVSRCCRRQSEMRIAPRLGSDSTQILPPCNSTSAFEIARPRPVPLGFALPFRRSDRTYRKSFPFLLAEFPDRYRDRNLNPFLAVPLSIHLHPALSGRKLDRIVDQVQQHLRDLSRSAHTRIDGPAIATSSAIGFSAATGLKVSTTSCTRPPRETRVELSSIFPASIFERSKKIVDQPG